MKCNSSYGVSREHSPSITIPVKGKARAGSELSQWRGRGTGWDLDGGEAAVARIFDARLDLAHAGLDARVDLTALELRLLHAVLLEPRARVLVLAVRCTAQAENIRSP